MNTSSLHEKKHRDIPATRNACDNGRLKTIWLNYQYVERGLHRKKKTGVLATAHSFDIRLPILRRYFHPVQQNTRSSMVLRANHNTSYREYPTRHIWPSSTKTRGSSPTASLQCPYQPGKKIRSSSGLLVAEELYPAHHLLQSSRCNKIPAHGQNRASNKYNNAAGQK